jgi:hypothetical protein
MPVEEDDEEEVDAPESGLVLVLASEEVVAVVVLEKLPEELSPGKERREELEAGRGMER